MLRCILLKENLIYINLQKTQASRGLFLYNLPGKSLFCRVRYTQDGPMRTPLPGTGRKFRNLSLGRGKVASKAFRSSPKLIQKVSGMVKAVEAGMGEAGNILYHCHYFIWPCRSSVKGGGVVLGAVLRCITSLRMVGRG